MILRGELAEERLVELAPNRGAVLKRFPPENATKLFEAIAALESLDAALEARQTEGQTIRRSPSIALITSWPTLVVKSGFETWSKTRAAGAFAPID